MQPACTLSLDLDDRWTYLKTHGDDAWKTFPSYLGIVVPRILRLLEKHSLRITFFIVGQDAEFERNAPVLRSIAEAGHEIGNHSFHHEPWLHLYSRAKIHEELARAEENIEQATGKRPHGFRGPGFSVSDAVVDVLAARGYSYDASTLPTFLGPIARAYYLWTTKLDPQEKKERARLFGRWRDGLRPLKPWFWTTPSGMLTELPVTTIPAIRTPFHLSYLIWLASYSPAIARAYLRFALGLCSLTGTPPSFLLHPLDFLGPREAPDLQFFPGMTQPLESKMELAEFTLQTFAQRYRILTMEDFAAQQTTSAVATTLARGTAAR
jgi:peptidoglycan-N-acetylglucosamine deacetylase